MNMTIRARAYLAVAALRHVALGVMALVIPAMFTSISLKQTLDVMSIMWWGLFFLVVGAGCIYAAWMKSEPVARVALVLSAAASSTWLGGFLAAAMHHQLNNPALPVAFGTLAAKDLIVCSQPLLSPFEHLAEHLKESSRAA